MPQLAAFGSAVRLTHSTLTFIGDSSIAPAIPGFREHGAHSRKEVGSLDRVEKASQASVLILALPLEDRGGIAANRAALSFLVCHSGT